MARARLIKWDDQIFDVDAMLALDPEIWPKTAASLTRCLLLFMEALEFAQSPDAAVRGLSDDLQRIAFLLFPGHYQAEQEYQERAEQRFRERQSKQKKTITRRLRTAVFERDAYRCRQCGDHHNLCADHIIPECKGGPTTLDNLQTLCRPCNSRKSGKMPE